MITIRNNAGYYLERVICLGYKENYRKEYKKYGKLDTVNELAKEVDILNKYLPQEMSEEEIIKIVNEVFEELKPSSMKDMGNLMKVISSKITNADMSLVSKIVKDKLLG